LILNGQPLADTILESLENSRKPFGKFVIIQIGSDEVSTLYVKKKLEVGARLGVEVNVLRLEENVAQAKLIKKIENINRDPSVSAILLQIPLPSQIKRAEVAATIDLKKDVDGFGYILNKAGAKIVPPTVLAIDGLLNYYQIEKSSKTIEIIGGGFLVGKPLYKYFVEQSLNARILEKDDPQYEERVRSADIVVAATGGGRRFRFTNFKAGATVVDASTMSENGQIKGDIDNIDWRDSVNLAPVPGGVGPVTVAMLYRNFFAMVNKDEK